MDFVTWIETELEEREWSRSDLARKSGVTPTQVTRVLSRKQGPGQDFIEGIARAFNMPVESVYRNANILPAAPDQDEWVSDMQYKLSQLNPELRGIAESVIEALRKNEEKGTGKKRH